MLFWTKRSPRYLGVCAGVCTLFYQEIGLDSVESLTLASSSLQLLLAVRQPPLLLSHSPLVVLVNLLQLLV